jgi:hypothetical protein
MADMANVNRHARDPDQPEPDGSRVMRSTKGSEIVGEQRRLRQGMTVLVPDFEAPHACSEMACERRYSRSAPVTFDMLEVGKQGHACNRQRDF